MSDLGPRAILVLTSLADGAKHGYAIMSDVYAFAGVQLGPGTVYGALDTLQAEGLVKRLPAEGRTHPFELTDRGRLVLLKLVDDYERVVKTAHKRL